MKPFYEKAIREIDDVEKPSVAFMRMRGWLIEKLVSQTRNGWPDRTALRKGRIVFIEFKRPGEVPNLQQAKRHKEIRDQGGEVFWITSLEETMRLFK